MRVLTFGWDFPPMKNGGLGVACSGLTRELDQEGVEVIFVLPKTQPVIGAPDFVFADRERITKRKETESLKETESGSLPYSSSDTIVTSIIEETLYDRQSVTYRRLIEEVYRFANKALSIAKDHQHDIIHAHDWTSYLAGVAAKRVSGRPLVLHVHATSFDQAAGDNVDPEIFKIECEGFAAADRIVTVSKYTRNLIIDKHGVDADKVEVVHNGCDTEEPVQHPPTLKELKDQGNKIILYHGRITIQKGVDHLVSAAAQVIAYEPKTVFVISGWGDMSTEIMDQVGALGLSNHFIFAGALWDEERDRMYQSADLVVMPSVSEPFGLVPLEAMQHGTASLISKQSGVAEVVTHVLKVDFWDVDEMANKIIASLRYPVMREQMVKEGKIEMLRLSWHVAAKKVRELYERLVQYATS